MNKRGLWIAGGVLAAVVALLVLVNVVQFPSTGETTAGTVKPAGYLFSDRRLKTDVVRVGTMPSGLPIYEYSIFDRREIGVMADEAEKLFPKAVVTGADGIKRVDYGAIR